MGHYGDDGSQGSRDEHSDRANETQFTGEDKQVTASSLSVVVEAGEDGKESQGSEEKASDRDVDRTLFAKIVGKMVGKGEDVVELVRVSQNIRTKAGFPQNGDQSKDTDISEAEKDASIEVGITVSILDQVTSVGSAIVAGFNTDYSVSDVSLVSEVVLDPRGRLADNGSLVLNANDGSGVQGKTLSSATDLGQASLCGSVLAQTACCETDRHSGDARTRVLTAARVWETVGDDVDLQCARNENDEDQAHEKVGTAEPKSSECCGVQDVASMLQSSQESESTVLDTPGMPSSDVRQQDVGFAEVSASAPPQDNLTGWLDNEEEVREVHVLEHDAMIVTGEDVIAPAGDSQGVRLEASTISASVKAMEAVSITASVMEKELVIDEQLLVRAADDSLLPIVDDGQGSNSVQCIDVLNNRKVSGDDKVDDLSGSVVNGISVGEAAPCDLGVDARRQSAVEAGIVPLSRPAGDQVTGFPEEELAGPQIAGIETVVRVDTFSSNDTIEDKDITMEMSGPKASVQNGEGNDPVVEELVSEETVMREEHAVEKRLQIAERSSSSVQDVLEKESEAAKGSVGFGTRRVGIADIAMQGMRAMKESELDRVKNLVKNLAREVSTKQEELSRERSMHTSGSPNLFGTFDMKVADSSSGAAAQKVDGPVDVSDCYVSSETPESRKLRELVLNGLNLLKSVAAHIAEGLDMGLRDSIGSVRGGKELVPSDQSKGKQLDESLAPAMKKQIGAESEVAVDFLSGSSSTVYPVATSEVVESTVVVGALSNDDRSLRGETATGVEPSQGAYPREETRMPEVLLISQQNPERLQVENFRPACLADYAVDHADDFRNASILVDSEVEPSNSVVHEGGAESIVCKDSVGGSLALEDKKVEGLVMPETTGLIGRLEISTTDEIREVSQQNMEQCSGGSQPLIEDVLETSRKGFNAASGEPDYPSVDALRGTCSLDSAVLAARFESSGEGKIEAAIREVSRVSFNKSRSYLKNEVEESSLEGDRVPVGVLRAEKVLAARKQDFLPVAKRTHPVVTNLEAVAKQAMEATYYRSHVLEDMKGPADIRAGNSLVEEQGGKCVNEGYRAQEKVNGGGLLPVRDFPLASYKGAEERLHGGGLENWDRPEVIRGMMAGDVAQSTHVVVASPDGNDPVKTRGLKSTMLVEAAENRYQLMASHEGSVKKKMRAAVEAAGSNPTVVVKKKLQTKRKKVAGEPEKKLTEAATLDPVPCDSQRAEATTTRAAKLVVEDVETNGPEERVGTLDDTGASPTLPETSAADQAMVLWAPEGDGVEGSPIDLVNGDQSQALALRCNCGKPAVLKTVGYKGQNRGKRYYSCEKYKPTFFTRKRNRKSDNDNLPSCRFFQWLDIPRVTMEGKKEIRLQKRRQLEQILAGKAVTTNYSTRSSSKQELSDHDAHRNQGLLEGVPPVSGLSVEEPKHEDSEEPEPSSKKQKLNKMDPSLSTADSVAFSTRASAARKRNGPCVADTNVDRSTPGNSSCGDESSHEVSVGDCNNSQPKKATKRVKLEAGKGDTPGQMCTRRGESSRPPRQTGYTPRAKNIGRLERATADTHHVRKLLPVALAYEKSREVILEESSEEEVSGDRKDDSNEEEHSQYVCSEGEDRVETPTFTSADKEQTPVRPRSQRASSTTRSGQNGKQTKSSRKVENSKRNVQKVRRDASGSETSLSWDLHRGRKQPPRWIDVPLTSPFEDKDSNKSGVSGHHVVQHGVGQYGPFAGNDELVVNFPTASQSGEKRTISSNTLQLVKEKAREAVNLRRGKSPTSETESQRAAWTKPAEQMRKRSAEHRDVSDSDEEETGPSGSRGLRSLKDMLKRENSDGTTADYEVADETQPPYCECKTVQRRAALKTVLSNSANQGLRYWVCVNHRPLFQKKSLWDGDPNDESCKFFRWLDTPIISYAERKKQVAARRRRNERRRR